MVRISWFLVCLLAAALGCGGNEADETQNLDPPSSETPSPAGSAEAEPVEEPAEVEGDLGALVAAPAEELGEQLEDLETTVREAVEEASAAETGSTYCESAYEGLAAMVARVAAQYPEDTRPMPPQPTFIHVCERLSPEAQQCLLPTYATAHREECGAVQAAMPEEDQRRLAEMLRGE